MVFVRYWIEKQNKNKPNQTKPNQTKPKQNKTKQNNNNNNNNILLAMILAITGALLMSLASTFDQISF